MSNDNDRSTTHAIAGDESRETGLTARAGWRVAAATAAVFRLPEPHFGRHRARLAAAFSLAARSRWRA